MGECDGRIALRENGRRLENSSKRYEMETGDRERSGRKVRKEKIKKRR